VLQTNFEQVYDPAAFELVHIDTDNASAAALHAHWDQYNPTFLVLTGCASIYSQYGNNYIPYNVILDTDGIVRYTASGFSEGAMHNIINQYMSVAYPVFTVQSLAIVSDDNGDGRPDGGETIHYDLSLRNSPIAVPATGCTVVMTCSDPAVTITQNTVTFPAAQPGETVEGSGPFVYTVAAGIEPHWATFSFAYSAPYNGGTATGTLTHTQRMGRPATLLVDSDGGMDDNETFVTSALDLAGIGHDVWLGLNNPLAAVEMDRYERILWLGGIKQNDVTDAEEAGLRAFLDGGGRLLLSSQFMSTNPARADFLADYFGVTVTDTDAGSVFVIDGVAGDTWFDGTAFVITGVQGANNSQDPDVLEVTAPGVVFGTWRQVANAPAAVYTTGTPYAAIFCGFPVEATRIHSSVTGSMNMPMFLEHVMDYFMGTGVAPAPNTGPRDFRLVQATPNPFNPTTTVEYRLEREGAVALAVFNTLGQELRRLEAGRQAAGTHARTLDGAELASGLYLVRLVVDGLPRDAMKVMLVK
jgi:hypothetical protein